MRRKATAIGIESGRMSKTLLYRLFGAGAVPRDAREQIQREGVVLQDEGIGGSVTLKKYRAPGRYHGWKRSWFSGSIVLTQEHFLAFKYSRPIIGIAWDEERFEELNVRLEKGDTLCVTFDASAFQESASGTVEVRLKTPLARALLDQIRQRSV